LTGEWPDPPRICCTIHNLAYQGVFQPSAFELTNLPYAYFNPKGVEYYGSLNCLKAGIVYADLITTVSPRYAREIMTPEFGCGLDGVLRDRKDSLIGILNGVDYDEWNTTNNPHLPTPFGPGTPSGKEAVKRHLQRELGLPEDPAIPLFGSVTRLVEQKGIDIQVAALEEMLGSGMQFVVLGSGQPYFEEACQELAVRHPEQVAARIGYDHALSHRIEGASDFFLMPSQFEPCGLNQLYSLRYGAVPIVRAVGGLDDSIIDATQDPERADGIKFHDYSARALAKAIRKALVLYGEKELLEHYRWNGMTADFSWDNTAGRYSKAFEALLE
jgi:starch synthase